jgi:hypothetical protein
MIEVEEIRKLRWEKEALVKRLVHQVAAVAGEIAKTVPEGVEVEVGGRRYGVIAVAAGGIREKFLAVEKENGGRGVFIDDKPGATFYLYGDLRARIDSASEEEFMFFAKHMKEILGAFIAKIRETITTLQVLTAGSEEGR